MTKRFFTHLFVVALASLALLGSQFLTIKPAKAIDFTTPSVVINELMWPGSTVSASDEWVELFNTTNQPVDISGWQLTHAAVSGTDLTLPAGSVIAANDYFLISNFDKGDSHTILDVIPDWVTASLSLNNTCSVIYLQDNSTEMVDGMACGANGNYLDGSNGVVKASMERIYPIMPGAFGSSWQTSVASGNLIDSATGKDLASPILLNDSTAPTTGTVTDITTSHTAFSTDTTRLSATWTGFVDEDTAISGYKVGVSATPSMAGLIRPLQLVRNTNAYTITDLNLVEGNKYYYVVEAINAVELASDPVFSRGVTVVRPTAPVTSLMAVDAPGDNGGSVIVSWLPSADADHYLLTYYRATDADKIVVNVGINTTYTLTGLINYPAIYQFDVIAVASNAIASSPVSALASAVDNVPPQPAVLTSVQTSCKSVTCHVTLAWESADASAAYYQIGYRVDGVEHRTMNIASTSIVLDLAPGKMYIFVVYVFDAAGNQSIPSNQLSKRLAVAAPVQPTKKSSPTIIYVPTAQAAEPAVSTPSAGNTVAAASADTSGSSDWVRLAFIVVILLAIAFGFYRLSRMLRLDDAEVAVKRKRGRPKGTVKKVAVAARRGRGRPKGSKNKN